MNHFNPLLRKSLVIILIVCFLGVLTLIFLTFLRPKAAEISDSKAIPYSISKVWSAVFDKKSYLQSKKEITKYTIYDTVLPRWTEYYGMNDSQNNKAVLVRKNSRFHYVSWSYRYEQIVGYKIKLDSIKPDQTLVSITERPIYYNTWASIYFNFLKPKATIQYEFLKVENTIQYMDSVLKSNNLE
ncbi:MAG: hypothetical protein ACOVP5_02255 [Chitinophagales bacterium]